MVIDLGEFKRDLAAQDHRHDPRRALPALLDRAEIEAGALRGRGLEMLWVDDPVALFFLQIQARAGCGCPDGKLRAGRLTRGRTARLHGDRQGPG